MSLAVANSPIVRTASPQASMKKPVVYRNLARESSAYKKITDKNFDKTKMLFGELTMFALRWSMLNFFAAAMFAQRERSLPTMTETQVPVGSSLVF